jgi:cell fate regulator YaaT (PSP1 superfamily)
LCCSTWLTDFRSVNTSAARYQQLSLNPQKLAGQCGKLKCCLNYELESYLEALKAFPRTDVILKTEKGDAIFQKMDIFKGLAWYAYREDPINWHTIKATHASEIIELNKNGKKAQSLEEYIFEVEEETNDFTDLVSQESLTRFDKPKRKKKRRKQKKFKRNAQ